MSEGMDSEKRLTTIRRRVEIGAVVIRFVTYAFLPLILSGCAGCGAPEQGNGDGNHGKGPGSLDIGGEGENGPPPGDESVGSCDGVHPAPDENHDCDGWCFFDEGGWVPCDDGTPTHAGEGEGAAGEGEGAAGEGEGSNAGEGEGSNAGEGEGEGAPPPPPPPLCGPITATPGQSTLSPRVLLVVDKSGSMAGDATSFAGSKWTAEVDALKGVVDSSSSQVEFGLMMFPSDPSNDACSAGALNVFVHLNAAFSISLTLDGASPGGATPTADTLTQAKGVLDLLPAAGGPKAVILATDGGPNCNSSLDGNTCRCASAPTDCQADSANCLDDVNTIAATAALNAAGYHTYVIGVPGSENFSDVLNAMANAGGTAQAGPTAYYDATSSASLSQALEDIVVRISSCTLTLSNAALADQLTVQINGATIPYDPNGQSGWNLVDPQTMQLYGAACTEVQNGNAQIDVTECTH